MGNLSSALQQLRMERKQAQARVESIDQAISVIESLTNLRLVFFTVDKDFFCT
jgi:hypothetical protein